MSQPLWWDVTIFSLAVEETLIRRVGASSASLAGELQWHRRPVAGRWQARVTQWPNRGSFWLMETADPGPARRPEKRD